MGLGFHFGYFGEENHQQKRIEWEFNGISKGY
jgi:hypothetical protein